jgi:hypothetical protein
MPRCFAFAAPVFAMLAAVGSAAEPAVQREPIEWSHIWIPDATRTDLPRVLLVGDSICEAYYGAVEKELQGKALVAKLTTSSSLGDPALLEQMKYILGNYKFAVIHFNNGLHGLAGFTEEAYQQDIPKLLKLIEENAPGAKLIWATSTPMRKPAPHLEEFHATNERVKARNRIVVRVASEKGIPVDDLYGLVESHPEYWMADGVHFQPAGQAVEAKQVARTILDVLPR